MKEELHCGGSRKCGGSSLGQGRCPEIRRGQALGCGGVVSQSQKIYEEHRVIKAHVLKTPEVLLETVWYPEPTRSEAYWGL